MKNYFTYIFIIVAGTITFSSCVYYGRTHSFVDHCTTDMVISDISSVQGERTFLM